MVKMRYRDEKKPPPRAIVFDKHFAVVINFGTCYAQVPRAEAKQNWNGNG